jgi:hypothetical protein
MRDYSTGDVAVLFHRGEIPERNFNGEEGLLNGDKRLSKTFKSHEP